MLINYKSTTVSTNTVCCIRVPGIPGGSAFTVDTEGVSFVSLGPASVVPCFCLSSYSTSKQPKS